MIVTIQNNAKNNKMFGLLVNLKNTTNKKYNFGGASTGGGPRPWPPGPLKSGPDPPVHFTFFLSYLIIVMWIVELNK